MIALLLILHLIPISTPPSIDRNSAMHTCSQIRTQRLGTVHIFCTIVNFTAKLQFVWSSVHRLTYKVVRIELLIVKMYIMVIWEFIKSLDSKTLKVALHFSNKTTRDGRRLRI